MPNNRRQREIRADRQRERMIGLLESLVDQAADEEAQR